MTSVFPGRPLPGDPKRTAVGFERWHERVAELSGPEAARVAAYAETPDGRDLLPAFFAHSPFLTDCLIKEPELPAAIAEEGAQTRFDRLVAETLAVAQNEEDMNRLMALLRRFKRRAALLIAIADLSGEWSLEPVGRAISRTADTAIGTAVSYLLGRLGRSGAIALPDPTNPQTGSGLIVLGMGKLGGFELNYSSDVDLIVFYDAEAPALRSVEDPGRHFIRLTRDLVRIMEERTRDGYVFRTDLRLRPDPGITPPAISVEAAEGYYASLAQPWERAAMIKARPVAGDPKAARHFLDYLSPFVWRRNLDFAAIEDIHAMRRQIRTHRGHGTIAVDGHNIKIGRGGIREIEFLIQTQQLIFGGRDRSLRTRSTLDAIDRLVIQDHLPADTAASVSDAYRALRTLEHRLQMVDDQQTQTLPSSAPEIESLARFCGVETAAEFRSWVTALLERVEAAYAEFFEEEEEPGPGGELAGRLSFTGTDDDPETLATLSRMGFGQPSTVVATVRGWLHGRYRAVRSDRSRRLLGQMLPALLAAVGKAADPDLTFTRFDEFLSRLPTGIQLFSMLRANPELLGLIADLLGTSRRLADHLARSPGQFDAVLSQGFFAELPQRRALEDELDRLLEAETEYEDVLNAMRRWTNDHRFRAGVQILRGIGREEDWSRHLSDVAEVAVSRVLAQVEDQFAMRHGRFGGPGLSVVAMGKLGGREMSIRSDLDLIMVFDGAPAVDQSDGRQPLGPAVYYTRLIQRFLSAITSPTSEGALFEVDMRLRPSGNAGPLATALDSFADYQKSSAWTWEHMALTRARVIAGPPELSARLASVVRETLVRPRDPAKLRADVLDMRGRILRQHGTDDPFDVKHHRGGLVDVEFTAQYLQLRHAATDPAVLHSGTAMAIEALTERGFLAKTDAAELLAALGASHRVQALLRLCFDGPAALDEPPKPLAEALARAVDPDRPPVEFRAVRARLTELLARSHAAFDRVLEADGDV